MLKGISPIIPPDLLMVLAEMGHGDEIVLGDGNFPAAANARRLVRCDGHPIPPLLDAILKLLPLDPYVDKPVGLMAVVPGDNTKPTIWKEYKDIISRYDERAADFESIERFAFYERASNAYAIVATGESALYANIILKKGVIKS
ncbi:MAG: L-fucose mutarotase [Spirochaetales bacterium]|jgi:L-fucose mutarotase|nr:L-fucose mutarotase [Spirochaetales bacterium]